MPNPNLTSGDVVPGFWGYLDFNTKGSGAQEDRRTLVWGCIGASAQATPNEPFLAVGQQDVDDMTERGSELASWYASTMSQPEAQSAEVWLMPVTAPAGGVASIYKFKVYTSGANPAKSGTLKLWCKSQALPDVGFSTTDTATTIASAIKDAFNATPDLPLATVTSSGAEVTITYIHKGTSGEDLPFRCYISPNGSGVTLSPGQLLFATNATGAGSVKVETGATSVSTALSGGETPAQVATAVAASFVASSYPITAVVDGSTPEQVNLLFVNNKDVRRVRASVITSTGLTVNLGSGATDGTGSTSSFSYNGTLGTGVPTLTTALANLATLESFRSWAAPWLDATTLGAMATNIETNANGSLTGQKQQLLTVCSPDSLTVAGAVPTAPSPNLTATAPRYAVLWSPDVPVQAMDIAVRIAAARASKWLDTPQFNWNEFEVKGSDRAPILAPPSRPSMSSLNTALRTYALAPVVKGRTGYLEVVKGRSTSLATDKRLWAWSAEAQAAYHHFDLGNFLRSRFRGTSIVRFGDPVAPGQHDADSFKRAAQERMRFWQSQGNYDGAEKLADAVQATPNQGNPFRIDLEYPESPVVDLDQVVYTGTFMSPAA